MRRLLVIGLDGATWDLLEPLSGEGALPTLGHMMHLGTWGGLTSTIPPVSGTAWLSLATGRNPGKTGIFGFGRRTERGERLLPITSASFRGRSFWDYLSHLGARVGVLNVPMLYPPYSLNGFMLGGVGSPRGEPITFPSELWAKVNKISKGYELFVPYAHERYDDEDLFLADVRRVLGKKADVMLEFMEKEYWDCCFVVLSCTDWVQHLMWKHIDESHPLHEPRTSTEYRPKFVEFWQQVDALVSRMVALAGPQANALIVSDHGFGPQRGRFNLPLWLEREGFLVRRKTTAPVLKKVVNRLARKLPSEGRRLPKAARAAASRFLRNDIAAQIDFEKSRAYALGHDISFGGIYLQASPHTFSGTVGDACDDTKSQVLTKLGDLPLELGSTATVSVFESTDIYWGPYARLAPDLVLTVGDWACAISEQDFRSPVFADGPYSRRYTGSHRPNGIFLACGPDFKNAGRVQDACIYDVAPTILDMFGVAVPSDMDGRVLVELLHRPSQSAPSGVAPGAVDEALDRAELGTEEDDRRLREQLRGLGYLE